MPTKTWVSGEDVLATDFNTYVQKQVISTFADTAARDAGIPTPSDGMMCYLTGVRQIQARINNAWKTLPHGELGYAQITTDSVVFTGSPTSISGLSLALPVQPAGRIIRIALQGMISADVVQSVSTQIIRVNGAQIIQANTLISSAASSTTLHLEGRYLTTGGSGGAVSIDVQAHALSGANKFLAGAAYPTYLTAVDVGGF